MGLLMVIRNVMTQAIVADPITEAAKMTLRPGEWYASQNTNVAVMLVARPSATEPVIGKARPVNSRYGISSHAIKPTHESEHESGKYGYDRSGNQRYNQHIVPLFPELVSCFTFFAH